MAGWNRKDEPRPEAAQRQRAGLLAWLAPPARIPRRRFWLGYVLPVAGLSVVVAGLDLLLTPGGGGLAEGPVARVGSLLLLWPLGVGMVGRLHDLGRSGWWLAAPLVLAGLIVAAAFAVTPRAASLLWVPGLLYVALVTAVAFLRGERTPNRYGPP